MGHVAGFRACNEALAALHGTGSSVADQPDFPRAGGGTWGAYTQAMQSEVLPSRPRRILVVEDDATVGSEIQAQLASVGVVTRAHNGIEALSMLRRGFKPDVIVTDVVMPRMDGITLCRFVKSHPNTSRIPVVMFSSAASVKDMVAGITAGARQYIFKSVGNQELASKVRESIRP